MVKYSTYKAKINMFDRAHKDEEVPGFFLSFSNWLRTLLQDHLVGRRNNTMSITIGIYLMP